MLKPDFICIGAQKAGTTWLHAQLASHPDAWMPPMKELHFFTRSGEDMVPRIRNRLKRADVQSDPRRLAFCRAMLGMAETGRAGQIDAYAELFAPIGDRVAGEVTPAYSTLPRKWAEDFARAFPETRILLILRDPAERLWSQACMAARNRDKPQITADPAAFEAFMTRGGTMARSMLSETAAAWR